MIIRTPAPVRSLELIGTSLADAMRKGRFADRNDSGRNVALGLILGPFVKCGPKIKEGATLFGYVTSALIIRHSPWLFRNLKEATILRAYRA